MRKLLAALLLLPTLLFAEQTKTVFNPFTGKLDYITALSSSSLPSGSTQYIQNSGSPTTATQVASLASFNATLTSVTVTGTNTFLVSRTSVAVGGTMPAANQKVLITCPSPGCIGLKITTTGISNPTGILLNSSDLALFIESGNVQFGNGLTLSRPLKLDSVGVVTAAKIDMASTNDVTGVLPSANLPTTVVYTDTNQTISGFKTLTSSLTVTGADGFRTTYGAVLGSATVTDDAYGAGWNGSVQVPTKNALYDKIETISMGGDNLGNGTGSFGVNTTTGGFSTSLIVAGQSVCLEDGTDCPAAGGIAGTYTPTRSAEANTTGNATTFESQYLQVGSVVTVSGRFTVTPTLTATATSFEIDLPVASNIGAVEDLAGTAFCGVIAGMGASIEGSVANNTAVFKWVSTDISARSWSYSFQYQVI